VRFVYQPREFAARAVIACSTGIAVLAAAHARNVDAQATAQTASPCSAAFRGNPPIQRLANNPPPVPTLLTPANGTTTDKTPTFTWTEVRDSEGDTVIFQIEIDDNPDFSSPEIATRGQRHTSLTPERPLRAATYCWRVRAIDDIEARSQYSPAFEVTIRPAGVGAAPAGR
jgi:hypothetical protein